ncbi:hypothetical protein [Bdellovibrio bacteriovorus]|nr:hypothetical protein [Bdellovibrio bacteriovorus]
MTPQKWTSVLLISLLIFTSSTSTAQANRSVKRNVAAVLFSTLGGAILGLSTLSFYGEPQEHTGNITTGALVGLLGGVGYVIYDSSRPAAPQYEYSQNLGMDFKNRRASETFVAKAPPMIQYSFTF